MLYIWQHLALLSDAQFLSPPQCPLDHHSPHSLTHIHTPQAAKTAGGPTRIERAKIGLIQFHLSPPKADIENTVVISDYAQVRGRGGGARGVCRRRGV